MIRDLDKEEALDLLNEVWSEIRSLGAKGGPGDPGASEYERGVYEGLQRAAKVIEEYEAHLGRDGKPARAPS